MTLQCTDNCLTKFHFSFCSWSKFLLLHTPQRHRADSEGNADAESHPAAVGSYWYNRLSHKTQFMKIGYFLYIFHLLVKIELSSENMLALFSHTFINMKLSKFMLHKSASNLGSLICPEKKWWEFSWNKSRSRLLFVLSFYICELFKSITLS